MDRRADTDLYREAEAIFGTDRFGRLGLSGRHLLLTCPLLNAFEIPTPK